MKKTRVASERDSNNIGKKSMQLQKNQQEKVKKKKVS